MNEATVMTQVRIMINASSLSDAQGIASSLRGELMKVTISSREEETQTDFERCQPDVLVMAFHGLDETERRYRQLLQDSVFARTHPHRTLVLCRTEDVPKAYDKCLNGIFNDYMQFWPMTFDAYRLTMSIRQALRDLHMTDALARMQIERSALEKMPTAIEPKIPTVLVIEDDVFQQKILHRMLTKEHLRCDLAGSGHAALSELEANQPDLILLDYHLPDTDGVKLLRKLRLMPALAKVPVIMLTGNGDKNIVVECLKAGANDYIVKPVSAERLHERLQRFMPQAPVAPL